MTDRPPRRIASRLFTCLFFFPTYFALSPQCSTHHSQLCCLFFSSLSLAQHEEEPSCYFWCMNVSERCYALATGLFIFARVRRHLLYLRGSPPRPSPGSHASQGPSLYPRECFLRLPGEKQTHKPAFFLRQSLWQKCVWPGTRTFFARQVFPLGSST